MIEFLFGVLTGLAVAILFVITLIYFKGPVVHVTEVIKKQVVNAGPREKGHIYEAPSEAEDMRQDIIEKNRAQGKDTKIDELR